MKILHTSDWHLGQTLYGYDRMEEHQDFFNQLQEIVIAETPDAMLVSGDIFDVSTPSSGCMRMFTDNILRLHDALPSMTIVITSGNHDSASRIDVNRNLWRKAGIHVIGNVPRDADGNYDFSGNLIRIGDKGVVMAVPFVNRAFMKADGDGSVPEMVFFRLAAEAVEKGVGKCFPCVLMAHLTIDGCDMRGHRKGETGNVNAVDESIFPDIFNYVALGHIHRPQTLGERRRTRYGGTPVAVNFDEDYPHTVSIVEVKADAAPDIREIAIEQLRDLVTFPPEGVSFKEAIRKLKKFPADSNCYIRLNVEQERDLEADCQEQASAAASGKNCRFCVIKYTRPEREGRTGSDDSFTVAEFSELDPEDIAGRFFAASGISDALAGEYLSLIRDLHEELERNQSL